MSSGEVTDKQMPMQALGPLAEKVAIARKSCPKRVKRRYLRLFIEESQWDKIALASLLILLFVLFVPVLASARPQSWQPPCPESFWGSIASAFRRNSEFGYHPTSVVSLSCDYFTFGFDYLVFYRLHSFFGQLCKTAFLWLLLRNLRVGRYLAFGFAFLTAIWPSHIEMVMTPYMRGRIALSLFSYLSLWAALHVSSRRWKWWIFVSSLSAFIAMGASLWAALLIPFIPILAFTFGWNGRMDDFPWPRILIPEIVATLTFLFVAYMS